MLSYNQRVSSRQVYLTSSSIRTKIWRYRASGESRPQGSSQTLKKSDCDPSRQQYTRWREWSPINCLHDPLKHGSTQWIICLHSVDGSSGCSINGSSNSSGCTVLMDHLATVLMDHLAAVLMGHLTAVLMDHLATVLMGNLAAQC